MKFENTQVFGMENAMYGMRLPMCKDFQEAVEKSDSVFSYMISKGEYQPAEAAKCCSIGPDDMKIAKNLINADSKGGGQPNSKYLRMIHVQVAITAPLYFFKELDTYKVGTVSNSTSTMHKLASTPITMDCFEMDDFEDFSFMIGKEGEYVCGDGLVYDSKRQWENDTYLFEVLRQKYNELVENKKHLEEIKEFEEAKKAQAMAKKYWKALIRKLPESWLQTRMFDCDYATLRNMYKWRKDHKLTEWHRFCDWIKTLPYAEELLLIS